MYVCGVSNCFHLDTIDYLLFTESLLLRQFVLLMRYHNRAEICSFAVRSLHFLDPIKANVVHKFSFSNL
jgi:hypothetical protein